MHPQDLIIPTKSMCTTFLTINIVNISYRFFVYRVFYGGMYKKRSVFYVQQLLAVLYERVYDMFVLLPKSFDTTVD